MDWLKQLQRASNQADLVICQAIEIPASEDPPTELRLAAPGTYKGHPTGPIEVNASFAEACDRNRQELGFRPPIDERHRTSAPFLSAPRFGSVGRYEFREDGMYACDLTWNDRGQTSLAGDDYGYCSMGFLRSLKHPKTGEDMGPVQTHLSLVPVPFFGGETAVAALQGEDENMDWDDVIKQALADPTAKAKVLAALLPESTAPKNIEVVATGPSATVLARLGLAEDATDEDVLAELDRRDDDQAQAIVNAGIAAGKVPSDPESELHKEMLVLAKANPEATTKVIASLPSQAPEAAPATPDESPAGSEVDDDAPDLDDSQKAVNTELGLTDEDWTKYAPRD